jgi:hypothetical protein
MKPRFEPVTPRPVRTITEYRKRLVSEKRAALHARLAREVREVQEQKGKGNDASR